MSEGISLKANNFVLSTFILFSLISRETPHRIIDQVLQLHVLCQRRGRNYGGFERKSEYSQLENVLFSLLDLALRERYDCKQRHLEDSGASAIGAAAASMHALEELE
jgi:hypothetical protein